MSYQVLARKWRPQNFVELAGQDHVLQALMNALTQQRLHHAYLFTGTRGVGKTTIARIFAKCLNCETNGISPEPCGTCSSCTEITEGRFVDLIEVDAASRTKVEDTRELLDNVQYAPTRGRFKVYLIDEVHMLSTHSFNALLKTLEEPPEHVKFLLATTDPQKLPVTILSRCLQFNLKNMSAQRVVNYLKTVLASEKIDYEDAALWQIGQAADGSMRDALSLTDQAISFGNGYIRETDVTAMLGLVNHAQIVSLLECIVSNDAAKVLQRIAELADYQPDFVAICASLLDLLHRIAIEQQVPGALENQFGDLAQVQALAASLNTETVQLFYQNLLIGKRDLPLSHSLKAGFEMLLLRLIAFRPSARVAVSSVPLDSPNPANISGITASTNNDVTDVNRDAGGVTMSHQSDTAQNNAAYDNEINSFVENASEEVVAEIAEEKKTLADTVEAKEYKAANDQPSSSSLETINTLGTSDALAAQALAVSEAPAVSKTTNPQVVRFPSEEHKADHSDTTLTESFQAESTTKEIIKELTLSSSKAKSSNEPSTVNSSQTKPATQDTAVASLNSDEDSDLDEDEIDESLETMHQAEDLMALVQVGNDGTESVDNQSTGTSLAEAVLDKDVALEENALEEMTIAKNGSDGVYTKEQIIAQPALGLPVDIVEGFSELTMQMWWLIAPRLPLKGLVHNILMNSSLIESTTQGIKLEVPLEYGHMLNQLRYEQIQNAIGDYFDQPMPLIIDTVENVSTITAEEFAASKRSEAMQAAVKHLNEHPIVLALSSTMGGQLVYESVKVKA